jgi:rare lipoprotein A
LKVTNQHNDKHVTVRVNDRGPFVSARIIDVSRAAAEQLDMINTGTAPVTVEGIERIVRDSGGDAADGDSAEDTQPVVAEARPASAAAQPADSAVYPASPAVRPPAQAAPVQTFALPPAEIKPAIPPAGSAKRYRLQVGAYKIPRNAADAFDRLKNAGLDPAYEHVGDLYRVVISGVPGGEVRAAAEKIGAAGFREALIREEP